MPLSDGGDGVTVGYIGSTKLVAGYVGTNQVFGGGGSVTIMGDIYAGTGYSGTSTYSESGSANDTGSFNIVLTASSGMEFTNNSVSATGIDSGTGLTFPSHGTLSNSNKTLTISVSYTLPSSSVTDNFTVNANTKSSNVTGTVTYSYASKVTGNVTPTTFNAAPGTSVNYSGTLTAASDYEFSGGSSTKSVSGSFTVPDSGNVTVDLSGNTVSQKTYGGNITYQTSTNNVTLSITPKTYTNKVAGHAINYSGTAYSTKGYEFTDGTTQKTVSGSFNVPSGGGNVTVAVSVDDTEVANTAPTITISGGTNGKTGVGGVMLTAVASDSDGTLASYSWKIISGSGTLSSTNTANTTLSSSVQGNITVRCTVTDDEGLDAFDDHTVNFITADATSGSFGSNSVDFTIGMAGSFTQTVTANGTWNITGGGNNITISPSSGNGNRNVTITYNGASNAKDGTFTLWSGNSQSTSLDTSVLSFGA